MPASVVGDASTRAGAGAGVGAAAARVLSIRRGVGAVEVVESGASASGAPASIVGDASTRAGAGAGVGAAAAPLSVRRGGGGAAKVEASSVPDAVVERDVVVEDPGCVETK